MLAFCIQSRPSLLTWDQRFCLPVKVGGYIGCFLGKQSRQVGVCTVAQAVVERGVTT